jgi:GntR family transcriptional regulator
MVSGSTGAAPSVAYAEPMTRKGNLPMRAAVYDKIAQAIRSGILRPNDLLAPEAELGAAFRVSRTVMREALILLEEDGLVRTQRGIGRFVVDTLPTVGIEVLRPAEIFLSRNIGPLPVKRLSTGRENVTDFTMRGLKLDSDASVVIWESLVIEDDQNVALLQEWIRVDDSASNLNDELLEILAKASSGNTSMLGALIGGFEEKLGPGSCEVSVSNAGAYRAQMLGITVTSPVLILNQTVLYRRIPLMVGKYIIRPEVGHLTINQS